MATGARWGKAEGLQARQVRDGMVHYFKTKSSKNRSVPISRKLAAQVAEALPFKSGCNKFRQAVEAIDLDLLEGQLAHVLRGIRLRATICQKVAIF